MCSADFKSILLGFSPNVFRDSVTAWPLFNDISNIVDYLPGCTAQDIANGLFDWVKEGDLFGHDIAMNFDDKGN